MEMEKKLIVITSRHDCCDNRIYEKQIKSMLSAGFEIVYLFPTCTNALPQGHNFTPISLKSESIFKRHIEIFNHVRKEAIEKVLIHDPDLLIVGLILKWFYRKIVFFDAHENIALDIKVNKNYNTVKAQALSWLMDMFLDFSLKRLAGVVTVTEDIERIYKDKGANVKVVKNYPVIKKNPDVLNKSLRLIVYSGTISKSRGFDTMIELMKFLPEFNLFLIGWTSPCITEKELRNLPTNVRYLGHQSAENVQKIYAKASFGLCLLNPLPTFKESLPIKILEYTGNGVIPVVSDFEYWREYYPERLGIIYSTTLQTTVEKIRGQKSRNINVIINETSKNFSWHEEEKKLKSFIGLCVDF